MSRTDVILITCEHGGNGIPPSLTPLFRNRSRLLKSHYAYDAGALPVARRMAARLEAPVLFSTVSRLVVDLNRSRDNRAVFSFLTRTLSNSEREDLLKRYYRPHRNAVRDLIRVSRTDRVLHVAVHSFTPVLRGKPRTADIGLLYDPARKVEARLCVAWQDALASATDWRVRRNYPYRGASDGLATALRREFGPARYIGIELEINQACIRSAAAQRKCADLLVDCLPRT